MADEIINKNHPRIIEVRSKSQQAFDSLAIIRESHHIILGGVCFLTDKEVAERLRVSRRTVQNYRDAGIIAYYIIGGKCLYAESDINKLLQQNYHPRFDDTFPE